MHTLANDFVNLPIIVSDYDAIVSTPAPESEPSRAIEATRSASSAAATTSRGGSSPSPQNWGTGFNDFVDNMWSCMTTGMKTKLREACVEVLRRTNDPVEEERLWGVWDEDARFLD
ncbi:hypothetical protein B0A50_01763 [Salinomyces thailandicus]|uniref:Uncharacterized protein n=1 Tax=Salinomyces thailandicus TaxID=706561 RepID=A0A4U0UBP6_9PEZI|nr:hypothetical protein B0A50_01763 [Salinomyces thailandica]